MSATLILVTGRPATGKSHIARLLSDMLSVPVISKDGFKEVLFNSLGVRDRQWSTELGKASFVLIDYVLEEQLKAGKSVILESPLNPEIENAKFKRWQENYGYRAIQVICGGDGDILFNRFQKRALDGSRHVGHQDAENLEESRKKFRQPVGEERIDIDSYVIRVNVNDFDALDLEALFQEVKGAIGPTSL